MELIIILLSYLIGCVLTTVLVDYLLKLGKNIIDHENEIEYRIKKYLE